MALKVKLAVNISFFDNCCLAVLQIMPQSVPDRCLCLLPVLILVSLILVRRAELIFSLSVLIDVAREARLIV